jgi:transposase
VVLGSVVIARPEKGKQHLCADTGYTGKPSAKIIKSFRYIAHVRGRGEEAAAKKTHKGGKARRWVVECTHSWFNRFRKLLVRYEKTLASYLALMHLAASIICWRKVGVIYG